MKDTNMNIETIIQIAERAGDAIMDIYKNEEDFGIEAKADDSPLTKADQASNDVICRGLEALSTQYPIISEENKLMAYEDRKDFERFWLVDPLDGTKEFIKRNGEFTVNIALIENGAPIVGVVYAPVLDEMYWGIVGEGAFLRKNGETREISASKFNMVQPGLRVVCSRSHLNEETQAFIDNLIDPEKVSQGSSLKFLVLARGSAELYPRIAPTMEWDTAAAQCVLEAAGGTVLEYETKQPLRYNKESLLNPYFVAQGQLT